MHQNINPSSETNKNNHKPTKNKRKYKQCNHVVIMLKCLEFVENFVKKICIQSSFFGERYKESFLEDDKSSTIRLKEKMRKYGHLYSENKPLESLDVVPRYMENINGDWILKYSDSETNTHPFKNNLDFALVPWRKNRSIDPLNAPCFEPIDQTKVLQKFHKLEVKRNRTQLKKRLQSEKLLQLRKKRNVKVRLLFQLEMKKRKIDCLGSSNRFQQRSFQRLSPLAVDLPKMGKIPSLPKTGNIIIIEENECFEKHLGYFSHRFLDQQIKEKAENKKNLKKLNSIKDKGRQNKYLNSVKKTNEYKSISEYYVSECESTDLLCKKCRKR